MKSYFLFICFLFAFTNRAKSQINQTESLDSFVLFFAENVLFKSTNNKKIIVLPTLSFERLNINQLMETVFWRKLQIAVNSSDTNYLKQIVKSSPEFKLSNDTKFEKLIFIDSLQYNTAVFNNIQRKYHYPSVIEVSRMVFTRNNQECFVFFQIIGSAGQTTVLKRDPNGKWRVDGISTDWLE